MLAAKTFHHVVTQHRELICLKTNLFVPTSYFPARQHLQAEENRKAEVEGETPLSGATWPEMATRKVDLHQTVISADTAIAEKGQTKVVMCKELMDSCRVCELLHCSDLGFQEAVHS